MVTGVDNSYLLALYSGSTSSSGGFDYSALALGVTGTAAGAAAVTKPVAPTAPWNTTAPTAAQTSAAVTSALAGNSLINESAAQLDLPGASQDYRKLFALYQGLTTLGDLAAQATSKGMTSGDVANLQKTFASGVAQVSTYLGNASFDQLRLADGVVSTTDRAKLTVPQAQTSYTTPPLTSSTSDEVPAFQGNVQFNISIKRINTTVNVPIDLSGMGSQPRTIGNVVNFINDQLAATGMGTRVQSLREPGQPRTLTSGGQTITLPATSDQWALKVNVGTSEAVTFTAPQTAGAVYLTQATGDPNPDKDPTTTADSHVQQQLLKFQTDTTNVAAPLQGAGQANWVDGRIFSDTLGNEVGTIHATQTAPDGSVYMLADVTAATDGQSIRGAQDVALLKYNSAGQLVYSRTLGASDSATGLGLAVSADGKVAVTGSVTGTLDGSTDGALNSGATGAFSANTDSFVTLYDASGNEQWTERRGGRENDEASQVTFGADDTVYVAGRTQSALPGTTSIGGYDGYVEAFTTDSKGAPKVQFTQTFGTTDSDKPAGLVVSGNSLITASVEGGHAVLRNFDISSGAPVLSSTRDLGDLQGGSIAGLALDGGNVVVAGTTSNGALNAGTVTSAASGGTDGFAAEVSADLSTQPTDSIAYYGGSGDDKVTGMAVSNGKVWLTGQAGTDLPATTPLGTKDNFLTSLDVSSGTVDWSRRFTGRDGYATPSSIAVAASGASVLDAIGLPSGTLQLSDSQQLTAQSSLRPGDQFTVQGGGGILQKVTIDPGETLTTLATKITRASGFQATVTTPTVNGVQSLVITPLNPRETITIGNGPAGKDALPTLGLTAGVIAATTTSTVNGTTTTVPADGKGPLYGLGIDSTLNLSDASQISHAQAQIAAAINVIRKAYQDLVTAATPQTAETTAQKAAAASGPVPAYLTAQIANYQAGLARLTGSGG